MWRRLKNLWKLSAVEYSKSEIGVAEARSVLQSTVPNKMATIIDMQAENQLEKDFEEQKDV